MSIPVPVVRTPVAIRRGGLLEQYFYFLMAAPIPAIVVLGFRTAIKQNLIHPAIPRPLILSVHAAVFSPAVRSSAHAQRELAPLDRLV